VSILRNESINAKVCICFSCLTSELLTATGLIPLPSVVETKFKEMFETTDVFRNPDHIDTLMHSETWIGSPAAALDFLILLTKKN
jgi:hypothetical protein